MICIYCNKQQKPLKVGGIVYITCCDKIQMLRYTVRPRMRGFIENDPEVVLVDKKKGSV